MLDETQTNETTSTLDEKFTICPCCGKPTLPKPVQPNKQLVDHWLCCMISGEPFVHTYPLYDGKIELTIGALSIEDDTTLGTLASMFDALASNKDFITKASVNISQVKAMSRVCMSLHKVVIHAGGETKTYIPTELVKTALNELKPFYMDIMANTIDDELFGKLVKCFSALTSSNGISALPIDVLLTAIETHNQINNILMGSGFDENFWSGIKLV